MSHIKQRHQLGICPSPVDTNGFLVQTARSLGIYLGFESSKLTEARREASTKSESFRAKL